MIAFIYLFFISGRGRGSRGRMLSVVQVNSEQVVLESPAEAGDHVYYLFILQCQCDLHVNLN